jgi:hypothetical protein
MSHPFANDLTLVHVQIGFLQVLAKQNLRPMNTKAAQATNSSLLIAKGIEDSTSCFCENLGIFSVLKYPKLKVISHKTKPRICGAFE